MATAKTKITRSAQINLTDVTVDEVVAGATKVGAPMSARVSTGPGVQAPSTDEYFPYSVTYSWTEEV